MGKKPRLKKIVTTLCHQMKTAILATYAKKTPLFWRPSLDSSFWLWGVQFFLQYSDLLYLRWGNDFDQHLQCLYRYQKRECLLRHHHSTRAHERAGSRLFKFKLHDSGFPKHSNAFGKQHSHFLL
jgi:hypothetical protein